MSGLDELFSRLKAQSAETGQSASPSQSQSSPWPSNPAYRQPSVSSPLFSPPIHTPNPVHASDILSPVNPASTVGTPTPTSDSNRTNHLLNLLKFNGQKDSSQNQSSPLADLQNVAGDRPKSGLFPPVQNSEAIQTRLLSATDLVASLQRKPSASSSGPSPQPAAETSRAASSTTQPGNAQDFLLNLLTKPKVPPSTHAPPNNMQNQDRGTQNPPLTEPSEGTQGEREPSPAPHFGSVSSSGHPPDTPQTSAVNAFKYVNPFEQLHSSSPLNRERTPNQEQGHSGRQVEILKHSREASSQNGASTAPAAKSRKVESDDPISSSANPGDRKTQSVSEALENVGEETERQVEAALAKASNAIPDTQPPPYEDDVIKKEAHADDVDSSWESAEDEAAKDKTDELRVEVYNFPMKPFVSLQIKPTKTAQPFRQDNFMVIAQLKKDFDQIDRCLATASQSYIIYAQTATKKDNGGFRVIRQDTGDHKQIYRSSSERVFNVQLCNSAAPGNDVEAVLATGIHGSVFWTSLAKSRSDLFKDDDIESHGFILPPVSTAEENSSGSPVKTRAKVSSRHTEYFAVARGKQIYIVAPDTVKDPAYCHPATHKVDSERFFAEHTLKINTGKAGKDFCFSEDDTMIVSLDKNGRFKFWDIRDLTKQATDRSGASHEPVELRDPLWTLNAAASGVKADEKPSVSSIMFLDKEKPVTKGTALRYVIIGFKQNHILQLWDLGLGKAVQEIRLPHEKDSDGICSISYHPKTGIITIGHPTRNSIYFIHLSAPKYNLPAMEQSKYVGMLAQGDTTLPKPDSTAIMSGLREFSFAKVGHLRSVEMLKSPIDNGFERDSEDETLFELYAMHSRGVMCIPIKRKDLGWDVNSKMLIPKDALAEGVIEVSELIQPQKLPAAVEQASGAEGTKSSKAVPSKKAEPAKAVDVKRETSQPPATAGNGSTRVEGPSEGQAQNVRNQNVQKQSSSSQTHASYALAAQRPKSNVGEKGALAAENGSKSIAHADNSTVAAVSGAGAAEIQAAVAEQFETLYQRLDADKRVQEAAAGAKQDALLRLVSSTLTENVDRSLSDIIAKRIELDVLPSLTNITSEAIDRKLAESVPQQLKSAISAAFKSALPDALQDALKNREIQQTISNITGNQVATKVQQQVSALLQQTLPDMASQGVQKMVSDLETRLNQQVRQAESRHREDGAKIQELSSLVRSLSTTIQSMAETQTAFQGEILKMQRESKAMVTASKESSASTGGPDPQKEVEDAEVARLTEMLVAGKYEEATIQWISSDRQADLFDKLFVRLDPSYLQQVTPLVALTVSAAITSSFETLVAERLNWLGNVLNQINIHDADIKDVAPKILDVLSQRLQGAYMHIAEINPNDPSLRTISTLSRQVSEIRRLAA